LLIAVTSLETWLTNSSNALVVLTSGKIPANELTDDAANIDNKIFSYFQTFLK